MRFRFCFIPLILQFGFTLLITNSLVAETRSTPFVLDDEENPDQIAMNNQGGIVFTLPNPHDSKKTRLYYKSTEHRVRAIRNPSGDAETHANETQSEIVNSLSGKVLALFLGPDDADQIKIAIQQEGEVFLENYEIVTDSSTSNRKLKKVGVSIPVTDLPTQARLIEDAGVRSCVACCCLTSLASCFCPCSIFATLMCFNRPCALLLETHIYYSEVRFRSDGALMGKARLTVKPSTEYSVEETAAFKNFLLSDNPHYNGSSLLESTQLTPSQIEFFRNNLVITISPNQTLLLVKATADTKEFFFKPAVQEGREALTPLPDI